MGLRGERRSHIGLRGESGAYIGLRGERGRLSVILIAGLSLMGVWLSETVV